MPTAQLNRGKRLQQPRQTQIAAWGIADSILLAARPYILGGSTGFWLRTHSTMTLIS